MREILENKLKNFGDNIAHSETEKSDIASRFTRATNEIKLLKT